MLLQPLELTWSHQKLNLRPVWKHMLLLRHMIFKYKFCVLLKYCWSWEIVFWRSTKKLWFFGKGVHCQKTHLNNLYDWGFKFLYLYCDWLINSKTEQLTLIGKQLIKAKFMSSFALISLQMYVEICLDTDKK